jgi:hypothetical protein
VSAVLAKLATHCTDANATVAVPNSLGPGELLARYGTPDQKGYFLPRLADGTLIPCFGLTGAHSGSDATSLIGSYGTVEERGGVLGVKATFKKRYITLAPVAGVVGIGIDLKDPDGLLKGEGDEGFTVLLLERDHPGLRMGPRHIPLNNAFMNGTVEGEDVWIPMESILGGQERCGFGWHMCVREGEGRGRERSEREKGRERSEREKERERSELERMLFCGGSGQSEGVERGASENDGCSSAAGAGKRWGCRGETPRTPPAAGEVARPARSHRLFCGGSGQAMGLSGGDPPNPPYSRRGRTGSHGLASLAPLSHPSQT